MKSVRIKELRKSTGTKQEKTEKNRKKQVQKNRKNEDKIKRIIEKIGDNR